MKPVKQYGLPDRPHTLGNCSGAASAEAGSIGVDVTAGGPGGGHLDPCGTTNAAGKTSIVRNDFVDTSELCFGAVIKFDFVQAGGSCFTGWGTGTP